MIKAVISDLAGTTVDFGSSAPAGAFIELFKRHNIVITQKQAREPMGLGKRDHIQVLLSMDDVAEQWLSKHGDSWTEQDVDNLYREFIPLQLEVLPSYGVIIPGLIDTVNALKDRNIPIAVTTGYNSEMMKVVLEGAAKQMFIPDASSCAEDVASGRPAPWMIYRCMEQLGSFPPSSVVNVGDTIPDVLSGCNAGVWSVGVVETGNMTGLNYDELKALDQNELLRIKENGRKAMLEAGAHYVLDSIAQLPALIDTINEKIIQGECP